MRWTRVRIGALLAVMGAGSAACSLALTRTEGQCNSHADCAARGGEFSNSVCTDTHVCIPLHADAGVADAGPCTKNSDCFVTNGLSLCRDNACVALNDKRCRSSDMGKTTDDALLVGIFAPRETTGEAPIDDATLLFKVAKVAIHEFNKVQASGAVPGLPPLVGVVCDEADPASVDHLISKLGARIALGPTQHANYVSIVGKTKLAGTVLVSTSEDDPALDGNPNADGLFWSVRPNRARRVKPLGAAIKTAIQMGAITGPVLVAAADDPSTANFVDRFVQADAGVPYTVVKYAVEGDPGYDPFYAPLVQRILDEKPELIVAASGVGLWENIINKVEGAWTAPKRPRYLLAERSSVVERQLSIIDANLDKDAGCACNVSSRVLGLDWRHDAAVYDAFKGAFTTEFSTAPPYSGPERSYDAVYMSVYATLRAIAGNAKLTGFGFKSGVAGLTAADGLPKNVGSIAIPEIVNGAGQSINLNGASGSLDFNLERGSPSGDSELYCVTKQRFCDTSIVFTSDSDSPPSGTNACDCFK